MRTIQIRDVPDEVHAELRKRAAAADLSLSKYCLRELERIASRPTMAEVIERARARPGGASSQAIVDAVRAGRDGDRV